jgi:hypothetical protein
MKYTPSVTIVHGYTGKDHLLPEIASNLRESLSCKSYATPSGARKVAERAIYSAIDSRSLYAGCAAGLRPVCTISGSALIQK